MPNCQGEGWKGGRETGRGREGRGETERERQGGREREGEGGRERERGEEGRREGWREAEFFNVLFSLENIKDM